MKTRKEQRREKNKRKSQGPRDPKKLIKEEIKMGNRIMRQDTIFNRKVNIPHLEVTTLGPAFSREVALKTLRRPEVVKTMKQEIQKISPCLSFNPPAKKDCGNDEIYSPSSRKGFYTPIPREKIVGIFGENDHNWTDLFVDRDQPLLRMKPCFQKEEWQSYFTTGKSRFCKTSGEVGYLDEQGFFRDVIKMDKNKRSQFFSVLSSHYVTSQLTENQAPSMTYGDLLWKLDNLDIIKLIGKGSLYSRSNAWEDFGKVVPESILKEFWGKFGNKEHNSISPLLVTATSSTKYLLEGFGFKELPYPQQPTPHYETYELKDIAGYFINPESKAIITTLTNAWRIIYALKLATRINSTMFYTGNSLGAIHNFHRQFDMLLPKTSSIFIQWQDNWDPHSLGPKYSPIESGYHTYNMNAGELSTEDRSIDYVGGQLLRCGTLLLMPTEPGISRSPENEKLLKIERDNYYID